MAAKLPTERVEEKSPQMDGRIERSKACRQADKQYAIVLAEWQTSRCSRRQAGNLYKPSEEKREGRTRKQTERQANLEVCKYVDFWAGRQTNRPARNFETKEADAQTNKKTGAMGRGKRDQRLTAAVSWRLCSYFSAPSRTRAHTHAYRRGA